MQLQMKTRCANCGATLDAEGPAYICSYECTFCSRCASELKGRCPNCTNELVRRPRREGCIAGAENDVPEGMGGIQPWLVWVASFGAWTLVAMAASVESYEWWKSHGNYMSYGSILGLQLSQILTYAPLTPLVFALATRFPI